MVKWTVGCSAEDTHPTGRWCSRNKSFTWETSKICWCCTGEICWGFFFQYGFCAVSHPLLNRMSSWAAVTGLPGLPQCLNDEIDCWSWWWAEWDVAGPSRAAMLQFTTLVNLHTGSANNQSSLAFAKDIFQTVFKITFDKLGLFQVLCQSFTSFRSV